MHGGGVESLVESGWRGVYLGRLSSPLTVVEHPEDVLAEREWKPGELTASGYPYIVKRMYRA